MIMGRHTKCCHLTKIAPQLSAQAAVWKFSPRLLRRLLAGVVLRLEVGKSRDLLRA
jgi:hypothetical protein